MLNRVTVFLVFGGFFLGAWSIYCATMLTQGSGTNRAIMQYTMPQPTVTASA